MRAIRFVALAALCLLFSGCSAAAPAPTVTPVHFRVCQIGIASDTQSQADSEQVTYGLQKAQIALGVHFVKSSLKSPNQADFVALVSRHCNLVVTTSDSLEKLASNVAAVKPAIRFYSVISSSTFESSGKSQPSNFSTISFDVSSVAYLAGYTAASSTKTGKVGVIAGEPSERIQAFIDGFSSGVSKLNAALSSSVQVLGSSAVESQFLGTSSDPEKVRSYAAKLVAQGADVLFLAAGPASSGVGSVATANSTKLVFANSDGWLDPANDAFKSLILTSATVNLASVVFNAVTAQLSPASPQFSGNYLGNLGNGGTALAPTHDQSFSTNLISEIGQLTQAAIAAESAK